MMTDNVKTKAIPVRNSLRGIVNNLGWTTTSTLLLVVAGLVLNLIVGNVFGDEGMGIYSLANTIYLLIGTVANIGQQAALTKYTAEHIDEPEIGKQFYSASLVLGTGFGCVATVLLIVFQARISYVFHMPALGGYLIILALSMPLFQFNKIALARLAGLRRMKYFAIGEGLRYLFILLLTIFATLWKPNQLVFVIWPYLLAEILLIPYCWLTTQLHRNLSFIGFKERFRELWRFGFQVVLQRVITELESRLDLMVAGYFLSQGDVGVYSVALLVARAFTVLPVAVQKVATPLMAEVYAKSQIRMLERFVNLSLQIVSISLSLMAVVVVVFFPQFISILYPHQPVFLEARPIFNILLIGFLLRGVGLAAASIFISIGRPDIELKIAPIVLMANFSISVLLASRGFGMNGIAIGASMGSIVIYLLWMILIPRMVDIHIEHRKIFTPFIFGLISIGLILLLSQFIPIIFSTLFLAVIYTLVVIKIYGFTSIFVELKP